MTNKDKKIIDSILSYIGLDSKLEQEFAKYVGGTYFDMTEEEFSEWLSKVEVK